MRLYIMYFDISYESKTGKRFVRQVKVLVRSLEPTASLATWRRQWPVIIYNKRIKPNLMSFFTPITTCADRPWNQPLRKCKHSLAVHWTTPQGNVIVLNVNLMLSDKQCSPLLFCLRPCNISSSHDVCFYWGIECLPSRKPT